MEDLTVVTREAFVHDLLDHVKKFFPERCQSLGETGTQALVEQGIEQAGSYNIVTRRETCKYVDVLFEFGAGFDRAAWAADILCDPVITDGVTRANRLVAAAKKLLEERGGS